MIPSEKIRNIAIIAHVDHGKTTLVDKLLREGGAFRANEVVAERAMDSMDLEREKGLTIKAKNACVHWNHHIINIVDTPGHADFGGEVERALNMVDGVLLLVDAVDGPQAQTRFVLRKAMELGLKVVVVINKVDRPHSDVHRVHDQVLELLMDLHANEEQFNAPFLYASARDGYAVAHPDDPKDGMRPLFEAIVTHVPPPHVVPRSPFLMMVSNLDWNDFVGRVAIGKVLGGRITVGDSIVCIHHDGRRERSVITKVFEFSGMSTSERKLATAGHIVGLSGFPEISIGETLCDQEDREPIPFKEIDPPTVEMRICVNDGPLAGRDGPHVTSRKIRDRLYRETRTNVAIRVSDTELATAFLVSARGPLQIAVIVEEMRREGYEMLVSKPEVILRNSPQGTLEPWENLWVEAPSDATGPILERIGNCRGRVAAMNQHGAMMSIEAAIPTRGLIGFETWLVNATGGRAVMSHLFLEYAPHAGPISGRHSGTLVSMDRGITTSYALDNLQDRGHLFIEPGDEVYEGMIVGENPRSEDMPVNPTRLKHLTNIRSQGEGKGIMLEPPVRMSLEAAIEYIAMDEYVEATPKTIRLRKKILNATLRKRTQRGEG
ncbi:MAG: translational GTPase TypA [Kiritimatiellia bacterium]|nr:translational GTPase TypA [Kiritimatiellia bacterium]